MKNANNNQIFREVWNKYQDALWRIEQSWNDKSINYNKRVTLTESVMEMIKIGKKLKIIELRHLNGVGD